ncbi:MAG: hypothetical protein FJ088_03905, partial [Deltaproteobacteria bacterium]|nr:hypothetical protein [Deltaproteobacteria bacterium]
PRIRMLSGYYKGCSGYISSYQTSEGRRGLDVTYYITLKDQAGIVRRTSTKHNALGKSFAPLA